MKFRKKPVVVEAEQFTFEMYDGVEAPPVGVVMLIQQPASNPTTRQFYIETLEGRMTVLPGDWVVTGVKGERYPCKPDIFEATYERCEQVADFGMA